MPIWLGYSVLALLLWGATGVTQKLSTNRISSERSFLLFAWAMIAISVVVLAFLHVQWNLKWTVVCFAIVGGMLNGLGALTSFRALESGGKASIVISLISLYPLLTILLAVVILRERLTSMQVTGVGIAIIAGILLSIEPEPETA
jgi:transporter family protein